MVLTKKIKPEAGDLLVAQNPQTYNCLVFSETGTPYDYDLDHVEFINCGRFAYKDSTIPDTEAELRSKFFLQYVEKGLISAKTQRDSGRYLPLTVTFGVTEYTFDMDTTAQSNISATITSFEAARQAAVSFGWPNDGTLPWTLYDNSVVPVTLSDLQAVHAAAVERGYQLHAQYQNTKATLEALLPQGL